MIAGELAVPKHGDAPDVVPVPLAAVEPTTTTTTRPNADTGSAELRLSRVETIRGDITPKSVVHSGNGIFIAQNMMYSHSITVYDRDFRLVATIPDTIDRSALDGIRTSDSARTTGAVQRLEGAPVEAAFTRDGSVAYVSNYQMYGPGYDNPGADGCGTADWDSSTVYRIPMDTLEIDEVIEVGAVPKFLAVTPDGRFVLVANWCSHDLSIVDTSTASEIKRVRIGRHPRGIAITPDGAQAYIAVMGGSEIAVLDVGAGVVTSWYRGVGANPRHLTISPDGAFLYVTLSGDGRVAKIDLAAGEVVASATTGSTPRSMTIADDGESLYVVNYRDDTVSKLRTADMTEIEEVAVGHHPIGVAYDDATRRLWVANYAGSLMVFDDRLAENR